MAKAEVLGGQAGETAGGWAWVKTAAVAVRKEQFAAAKMAAARAGRRLAAGAEVAAAAWVAAAGSDSGVGWVLPRQEAAAARTEQFAAAMREVARAGVRVQGWAVGWAVAWEGVVDLETCGAVKVAAVKTGQFAAAMTEV